MERKQQAYTAEFRSEAVKVVLVEGGSLSEAEKRLSVPKGDLVKRDHQGMGREPGRTPGNPCCGGSGNREQANVQRVVLSAHGAGPLKKKWLRTLPGNRFPGRVHEGGETPFSDWRDVRVLKVSRSGSYDWCAWAATATSRFAWTGNLIRGARAPGSSSMNTVSSRRAFSGGSTPSTSGTWSWGRSWRCGSSPNSRKGRAIRLPRQRDGGADRPVQGALKALTRKDHRPLLQRTGIKPVGPVFSDNARLRIGRAT